MDRFPLAAVDEPESDRLAGTSVKIEGAIADGNADSLSFNSRLTAVAEAFEISRRSYRHMRRNVGLAFLFNGVGIPSPERDNSVGNKDQLL